MFEIKSNQVTIFHFFSLIIEQIVAKAKQMENTRPLEKNASSFPGRLSG